MMDPRITPANGRVAAMYLKGKVKSKSFSNGVIKECSSGIVDLLSSPEGERVSQLFLGDRVRVFENVKGFAYVQVEKDNYCGYVNGNLLRPQSNITHWVSVSGSTLYFEDNFKKKEISELYLGGMVEVKNDDGVWAELTNGGFIPSCHLKKLKTKLSDYINVSRLFLNTPYLWGGCSRKGVDCSGLVQTALHSCGISCPRDTDMQEFLVGKRINVQDAEKGDLVFWKGHVGILSEKNILLHANAFHMSVVEEDFQAAKNRIEDSKGGKITTVRRL